MKTTVSSLFAIMILGALAPDADAGRRWRRVNCCQCCPAPSVGEPQPAGAGAGAGGVFVSPSGKQYRFHVATDGNEEQPELKLSSGTVELNSEAQSRQRAIELRRLGRPDDYTGGDRGEAKTSIVTGKPIESFASLVDLRNTLAADHAIRPMIHKVDNRIDMERRNVQVKAYLYLIYNEGDNDFHMILGSTDRDHNGTTMLTAEVSELPQGEDRATLQSVREKVKGYFRDHISDRRKPFDDPIPVLVTGSIFYDIDHGPGVVGSGVYKPNTSWEIHPVTAIRFLDEPG